MATYQELLQQRKTTQSSRPDLEQERVRISGELGLPERQNVIQTIRKNIADTERILEQAPRDVLQRSRQLGGPVTSSVLNRLTQARREPVVGQLGTLSRTQGVEEAGIRDVQNEIAQRLGLLQADRVTQDQEMNRLIDQTWEAEEREKDRQFQARMQAQQAAAARQLAAAQAEAQERLAKWRETLFGGDKEGEVAGTADQPIKINTSPQNPLQQGIDAFARGGGNLLQALLPKSVKQQVFNDVKNIPFLSDLGLRVGDAYNNLLNPSTKFIGYQSNPGQTIRQPLKRI